MATVCPVTNQIAIVKVMILELGGAAIDLVGRVSVSGELKVSKIIF